LALEASSPALAGHRTNTQNAIYRTAKWTVMTFISVDVKTGLEKQFDQPEGH